MLYELTKDIKVNKLYLVKRLGDLFHETKTLHGGPYLSRPEKQFESFFARYQDLLHDLTPQSEKALQELGYTEPYTYVRRNFAHGAMKAHITASIEMACKKVGATYRPRPKGMLLEFPVDASYEGHYLTKPYIPDDLFSIEWQGKERFYIHETDKDQEPIRRFGKDPFATSSWLRKCVAIPHVVRALREKLQRPVMVLSVTTNADHAQSMLDCIKEVSGPTNYHLVKSYPAFSGPFRVVPPLEDILTGWKRTEPYDEFSLVQ